MQKTPRARGFLQQKASGKWGEALKCAAQQTGTSAASLLSGSVPPSALGGDAASEPRLGIGLSSRGQSHRPGSTGESQTLSPSHTLGKAVALILASFLAGLGGFGSIH